MSADAQDVREITAPPSLGLLYPKAVLSGFGKRAKTLPATVYLRPDVAIDREHLAGYAKVCGFGVSDRLPATYPHVLAFPLAMQLMTQSGFPFPLVGLVHIGNRISQTRLLSAEEPLTVRVWAQGLAEHERGRQFEVVSQAEVDGQVVWRDVSTYLRREKSGPKDEAKRDETPELPEPSAVWRIGEDIGRRYAAVSGDRNPIHLHRLSARLFGFKRAIAHGMWTKARCLAAFSGRLPEAYSVDVKFKLPVLLPATVALRAAGSGADGWRFDLRSAKDARPYLEGTIDPA